MHIFSFTWLLKRLAIGHGENIANVLFIAFTFTEMFIWC